MQEVLEITSSLSDLIKGFKDGSKVAVLEPIIPFRFEILTDNQLNFAEGSIYSKFKIKGKDRKFSKTLWDSMICLLSISGRLVIYDNGSTQYHFYLEDNELHYGMNYLDYVFKYSELNIRTTTYIPGLDELINFNFKPYHKVYDEYIAKNSLAGDFSIEMYESPFVRLFSAKTPNGRRFYMESELDDAELSDPSFSFHIFSLMLKGKLKEMDCGSSHMSLSHTQRYIRKIHEVSYNEK